MDSTKELTQKIEGRIRARCVPTELFKDEPKMLGSDRRSSSEPVFECAVCSDVGMVTVFVEGVSKGVKRCECRTRKIIQAGLKDVPPEFGVPMLGSLAPRPGLHRDQRAVIEHMKQHPFESYLFCGENGTGKSHFAYALYVHALFAGRRSVACTLRELLDEFKRMEMREAGADGKAFMARVTPGQLQQDKERWTIVLDEFEKARVTEFTSEMLFALLDSAWKYGHQMIVTSNKSIEELIDRWGRIDEVYGRSIVKRLAATCNGIGFF